MKKTLVVLAALFAALTLSAQTSREEYSQRYSLLVSRLGYEGVGIETLITKWEAAYPDDVNMLVAKYNYYFVKSRKEQVVVKAQEKFMGEAPILSLPDSTGAKVNYFTEAFYDDELYGIASSSLDKAIRLSGSDASLRFSKIESLMAYEKESPDMATAALVSLIDYNCVSHPEWTWTDRPFYDSDFVSQVIDCCYLLYKIGSPSSLEAFKTVSEKMLSYYPKNVDVINNLGSYYMVAKSDYKTALKYYAKTLKIDPSNYPAARNAVMACRRSGNVKMEKKYLAILAKNSPDELERNSACVRLQSLK